VHAKGGCTRHAVNLELAGLAASASVVPRVDELSQFWL